MKRRRHTPEQIIRKLREAERMLGEGKTIAEVAKELGVSEQTYHRWRNQYGGMKADDAKRLKELERENASAEADRRRSGARDRGAEGDRPGKLVSPVRRRRAVAMLRDRLGVSERWACRVVGQHRSTQRHEPKLAEDDAVLRASCGSSRQSGRGGGIAARIIICARRAGRSTASGCSGCGARRACGSRSASASAGGWATRRSRPSGCAPSGPITCGRSTSSSTRPPTGGR